MPLSGSSILLLLSQQVRVSLKSKLSVCSTDRPHWVTMFDLNEIPEQPANELGAENGGNATALSATDRVNVEDPTTVRMSLSLPYPPSKDGGVNPATEAAVTPMEVPTPKRSAPSSLSLEMTSTKRPNVSISVVPSLWQQDLESEDHGVDNAMAVGGFESSLLQSQTHDHHRHLSDVKPERDLINNTPKVAYRFLGESSEDASTSRAPERFLDGASGIEPHKGLTRTILSLKNTLEPQAPSEGSTFGLSLGGIFCKSPPPCGGVDPVRHVLKGPDLYATGRPEQVPLASRKSTDLSPFWCGKLRTDETPHLTPIVAYCLGIMTPDSRLKKLPSILSSKRILKLEELERILHKGLAEPLTQFKPAEKASSEEVKRFHFMVKSLGSQGLSSEGKPASSAALISWEGDAKLCLISFSSIQGVIKFCKSSLILGALEDINALDRESLYGIICHSASGSLNEKIDPLQTSKSQRAGRTVTPSSNKVSVTSEANAAPAERGKETGTTNRIASPSNKRHHVTRSDFLSKSASMEPIRVSSRDDFDFEEAGKGTKRRYQKQLSAIDKIHETSGKHHSRYGDLDEDDIGTLNPQQIHSRQRERFNWNYGRPSQRQEWRSERLKDTFRWNKDDKDAQKQRAKEHQRHSYHDGEKGKGWKSQALEGDQHRNQDKPRHKERERSKDSTAEDLKLKPSSEKSLAGSKNKLSFLHRVSPDQDTGKISKKRDRDGEKEHVISVKRTRESEATASLHSEQPVKNTSCDLKCKPEIEQMKDQLPQKETVLVGKPDFPKPNRKPHTLDTRVSNHGRCDGIVGGIDTDSLVLNEKTITPLQRHGSVDELTRVSDEPSGLSVSMLGACEIKTSLNPSVLSCERNGTAEDGGPSKSDETLGDCMLDKVKDEKEDTGVEFSLDVFDKETRTWLLSKQNALYLQEELGVHATISPDLSNCEIDSKTDTQTGPLQVKISVIPSEPCDTAENKWFLDQAAAMVKTIASRGVFIKCLWYEGPVQIHPGDGAPSVPVIVKKIKGEDGKNLERIQDMTGVMIGVVLRKCGTGAPHEMEPLSRPRFIGLRLKCIRRKGLLEALKETEALLECVADHFSKELATHIATHIVDLQSSTFHPNEALSNEGSPSAAVIATKELLPNLPVKEEGFLDSPGSCKLDEAAVLASTQDVANKVSVAKEEPDEARLPQEQEVASRPLYVSNLSDHMTPIKIQNIFENALKEKLEPLADFDGLSELVADVRYIPDKSCAFVVLANDGLLNATLKLYAEDKTVFQGMNVELNPSEQESAFSRLGTRNTGSLGGVHGKAAILGKNEEENNGRRHDAVDNDSFSDCSNDQWYAENVAPRTDPFPGRPRPLFLSELMRNASAPAIKQLFEDIITTFIGTSLVSAGGRQLVLDVRYVPSRGCAFVDLATPELVDFMLDLHSRRPEVFMNMKMELGRKAVPYSAEEDTGGRLNIRLHGKSNFSSQTYGYRLSLASRKKMEKRTNGSFDLEDSDKGDDLLWLNARMKKQRSDPEKTIYADRLPENASEGMIRKIFERVLLQKLPREELDALGEHMITEVRHVPTKYCAFVVFATEDLTRTVLHLFNQDEDAFDFMRLKPHFHSRMEDLYKDELQDIDDIVHTSSFRERMANLDNDHARARQLDLHESRARSAAHRAITASAFREVDRRRSVYVDKIPEDLSESTMTEMFEKVFRHKKHGLDGLMVSQVAYFRDKFDPSKLCAFVEVKTEDGTQELVDFYNSNQDAFQGMRVRPGFKYTS